MRFLTQVGHRVEYLGSAEPDEYTRLEVGDKGTVSLIDDMGTIHVTWDNGIHLGLLPEVDRYKVIMPEEN
jgi:hypothetical protein